MPGVSATVADEIAALSEVGGVEAVRLIRREPDEAIARIVAGWPGNFDARRAVALGSVWLSRVPEEQDAFTRLFAILLERGFIATLRKHRLPLPETNRPAGGRFVDCRWPERKLTVELDGYRYHSSRHAWEQDRRREREAYGRGDQFRRYTWADVFEDQEPMLRELRALLY